MPCKHEGGSDPCKRHRTSRHCKTQKRRYDAATYIPTGRPRGMSTNVGYTNELLAAADLNSRCGQVGGWAYLNPAPQTKHDAFAKTSLGWRTVQVKTGNVRKSGSLHLTRRQGITSEIIALVDDRNMRIRYIANGTPLPPELPTKTTPLCRDIVCLTGGDNPNASL